MNRWISIALAFFGALVLLLLLFALTNPKFSVWFKGTGKVAGIVKDDFSVRGQLIQQSEESVSRGLSFLSSGDVGSASFEFKDAIRIDSNNYRAYYNLGLVYRVVGQFSQSEAAYRSCLDLAPKFYAARNNLANLFLIQGNIDSALAQADLATKACPDCTDFVDTRIDVLLAGKRWEDADSLWRRAYDRFPDHPGLLSKRDLFMAGREKP